MPIPFSRSRWDRIKADYAAWWQGDLERPLVHLTVTGNAPGRPEPELPWEEFTAFYTPETSAEAIVDRWDYDLSCQRYLADAFPTARPNFGPGVVAAFLGAEVHNGLGTVWFAPTEERELSDLHFTFDPDNYWLGRMSDISRAAAEQFAGSVVLGPPDLGGVLDILATFRPGESLLLDLYDAPDQVERLTWEIHDLWWRYFDLFADIHGPTNPGYSDWTPLFSESPYSILQCDFSYMIGPAMFNRFVLPELTASCQRLGNAFYHLDGPGALPHLDSLLGIRELRGIQWVPGDGGPDIGQWPEVYRRIHEGGKRNQAWTVDFVRGLEILDVLAEQIGTARGLMLVATISPEQEQDACALLERHGVPI